MKKLSVTVTALMLSLASTSVLAKPEAAQGFSAMTPTGVAVSADSIAIDKNEPLRVAKKIPSGEGGR